MRLFRILGFTAVSAAAFLVVASAGCLSDLDALVPFAPQLEASVTSCGNGFIETDIPDATPESCDPGGDASVGCSQCQVTCDGGVIDPSTKHCYFVAAGGVEFTSAQEKCDLFGAHVVTLHSYAEALLVDGLEAEGGPALDKAYWVGLEVRSGGNYFALNEGEPGVPAGGATANCPGCFAPDGGIAGGNDAGGPECVIARSGAWSRGPCKGLAGQHDVVCEREPVGQRSQSCGGLLCATFEVESGKKRYVIVASPASADEAKKFCASYTDGHLVMFDTVAEREQLAREVAPLLFPDIAFWVGLGSEDGVTWTWDDGKNEEGRPRIWGSDQPPQGIVGRALIRVSRDFDSQLAIAGNPNESRAFVCQRR